MQEQGRTQVLPCLFGFFLSPLLEERARERGGFEETIATSTPHPNPPLKGEGVRQLLEMV
jgi:hypothetical protein